MALAADTLRVFDAGSDLNQLPVKATSQIYKGSIVGLTAGYARALVAGDIFGGYAEENVLGGATDGLNKIHVKRRGLVRVAITSLAVTDIGKTAYASDDGTYTLTVSTNSPIGTIVRWESTGFGWVEFYTGISPRLSTLTLLTDDSGGTASDTLAAITGSYVEATIENTVATLAAKINSIINHLK